MESRKTIWDYGTQVLAVFGFTMLVMNIFCLTAGESARPFSSLFSLGGQGLSTATSFQFLAMSALIIAYRFFFFTDLLLKKMRIPARLTGMLIAVIATIAVFVTVFNWFPADEPRCWLMFLVCFGVSFGLSLAVSLLRVRSENRRMERALTKMKGESNDGIRS